MDASKNEGITPFPAPRRTWHAATVKRDVEVDMSGPLQIGLWFFPASPNSISPVLLRSSPACLM
jgi:hypothetical protein